ncbi:unnamed protein product [Mytilus coruscus]|uniref:BEN domain-containing protein n=1 Tax=Mytilus coruscus TaxID=42192 RepID=A0A6J8EVM7_MYTCO|nr:unnamed protein product [Mytilus coruscus]
MKLSGKEPAWKFSASTDQVTVQLIWNKAKEPEVSSGNSKPALKKKQNKPPSTRRRDAKRYDQWVQAKSSAATSAEVIPHTTKVDKNQQTEAKTALEGSREFNSSSGPGNFAKHIVELLYPELFTFECLRRFYSYNGDAKNNKNPLDTVRLQYLHQYVSHFFPEVTQQQAWKLMVVTKINEALRRPIPGKQKKKTL